MNKYNWLLSSPHSAAHKCPSLQIIQVLSGSQALPRSRPRMVPAQAGEQS